jgi:hypothetical protein
MKPGIKIWVLIISLLMFPHFLFSQTNAEISAGISLPEFLNLKIKFGNNFQICGSIGYLPLIQGWSLSTDLYYHFPIKAKDNKIRKWYLNSGLSYIPSSEAYSSQPEKTLLMFSRIGISFYFNKKDNLDGLHIVDGLDFDLGIMFQIWSNEEYSYGPHTVGQPRQIIRQENPSVIGPAASISYFFKL